MLTNDSLRAIDCGCVTLGSETRAFLTEKFLNVDVPVVDRIHEMRSCTTGHPAADRPIIDENNTSTFARGEVSSTYAGDSSADYADIGCEILRKRLRRKFLRRAFPERALLTGAFPSSLHLYRNRIALK